MPRLLALALVSVTLGNAFAPDRADAQRRFVFDSLNPETPTAISCGFCATEKFGVLFRELPPPATGLEPTDFPLVLETLEIGMASAGVSGGACMPDQDARTVDVIVEVYAGDAAPSAILELPVDAPWPGETLVFATDQASITLSVADSSDRYELTVNALEIRDEDSQPIRVESAQYIRAVVTIPSGQPDSSDICEPTFTSPGAFPVRDDNGVIANERSFIYAAGAGWFWNESVPGGAINGDWAVRLTAFAEGPGPSGDAGVPSDAGAGADAGALTDADVPMDAGAAADAGPTPAEAGCACRAIRPTSSGEHGAALCALLGLALGRRFFKRRLKRRLS